MTRALRLENVLTLLLVFIPLALLLEYVLHAEAAWIFVASGLAIVPLAGLMGKSTEALAARVGTGLGGLLKGRRAVIAVWMVYATLVMALLAAAAHLAEAALRPPRRPRRTWRAARPRTASSACRSSARRGRTACRPWSAGYPSSTCRCSYCGAPRPLAGSSSCSPARGRFARSLRPWPKLVRRWKGGST